MAVKIHHSATVHCAAELADAVEIGPGCFVGPDVTIGARSVLMSGACVQGPTRLGEDNVLYPHAVLGTAPQDLSYKGEATRLDVGRGNIFREFVTANRGTAKGGGVTRIGDHNLFMACVHVAHDCRLGCHIIVANNVLLAGHVQIDDRAVINGGAAFHHFVSVGKLAYVGGMSRVVHDVPPFVKVEGSPARVRALNTIGLKRNGFDDSVVSELDKAFRRMFRDGGPLSVVVDEIEQGRPVGDVRVLVEHVRRTLASRKGRYLEESRRDSGDG